MWSDRNVPCYEDGENCGDGDGSYVDPSVDGVVLGRRVRELEGRSAG